jgi:hypothetical protein
MRTKSKPNTKRLGDLAEIAFLARAAELGLHLSKPFGDNDPYDWIVVNEDKILRVQVKSTYQQKRNGLYQVFCARCLRHGWMPYDSSEIDILAVHVHPEHAWYIIPIQALRGRLSVVVYPGQQPEPGLYASYREAWHLLGCAEPVGVEDE